ncbi:hypothetical protein C9J27_05370 [Photobacterium kishitanii]|uniref:Uncharacterized protein n=1 Tax=Photobacterium kishitanii TaxID=318456 RepID=A0A2T3KLL3_9GAMM|nr:hypothetical protein C9J27_05370 [Photobacterium kishitanii]
MYLKNTNSALVQAYRFVNQYVVGSFKKIKMKNDKDKVTINGNSFAGCDIEIHNKKVIIDGVICRS